MPKILLDDDIIVRKKKNNIAQKIKYILVAIVFLAFVIFVSNIFSDILTLGKISINGLNRKTNIYIPKTEYNVLNFGEYKNEADASKLANAVALLGGAGYVRVENNNYIVLGAVYFNKTDAETVINQNKNENYKIVNNVYRIDKKAILNVESSADAEQIENIMNDIFKSIKEVYDISISLDKSELTHIMASSKINTIKIKFTINIAKINEINNRLGMIPLTDLKRLLILMESSLENTMLKVLADKNSISSVKYCLCECVDNVVKILNNI